MGTYKGFRVSGAMTNYVPLSRKSVTKTIALTSGQVYTASVRGTRGSVTLSGAATGNVTEGNPVTFTASSNSLTLTVTGYLKHIQVNNGYIATSEIWTRNAAITRAADVVAPVTNLQAGSKFGVNQGALLLDLNSVKSNAALSPFLDLIKTGASVTADGIRLLVNAAGGGTLKVRIYSGGVMTDHATSINLLSGGRLGLSWSGTELKLFLNGALAQTITQTIPNPINTIEFQAANNEVIYRTICTFAVRPSDANMVLSTNF